MKRSHLIIPSLLLGMSALLGARAVVGSLPLGLERTSNTTTQAAQTTSTVDQQVAAREAALQKAQEDLNAAVNRKFPELPPVPKVTKRAASTSRGASTPTRMAAAPASAPQSAPSPSAPRGGDDDGPNHDAFDDHGGEAEHGEDGDDHGGEREGESDDD